MNTDYRTNDNLENMECEEKEDLLLDDDQDDNLHADENDDSKIEVSKLLNANISKNLISMSFDTIVEKFNNFDFVLPKYQRKYVWTQEQIANLALSVIKNIPIPPIYVYQDHEDSTNVILDGQQRVISLFLYYNNLTVKNGKKKKLINFYEITKKYRNSDLTFKEVIEKECPYFIKTEYKVGEQNNINITYSGLQRNERRKLGARYIDVVFLDVKDEGRESVYSNIFNLLNSAGTPLAKQEIRNGVYRCKFYDMIHDLNNENKNWRKLFGSEHEKSKDVELLLRLVALEYYTEVSLDDDKKTLVTFKEDENGSFYKGSYNLFLDRFSQESLKFDSVKIDKIRNSLTNFFDKFKFIDKKYLETKGNKTINHLLLESLYVACIKTDENIAINNELINKIKCDSDYSSTTITSTSNKTNIEKRLTAIYRIIGND